MLDRLRNRWYTRDAMRKRSSKKKTEKKSEEQLAKEALSEAAAALGRLGGLKGGKARAIKLTAARRSEIAQEAARTRWSKHKEQSND